MLASKTAHKVDLHTHSIISHDGGITAKEYERLITSKTLDCIAITDHNETSFARIMQQKLGNRIIIGEEITTLEGEIIGLFLRETIPGGLSLEETISSIKHQRGLVYIPHPFETFRKGVQMNNLTKVQKHIDIIETFNGRGIFRGKAKLAANFANQNDLPGAASSDAHGSKGAGNTYTILSELPTRETLTELVSQASLNKRFAPLYTLFYPTINRLKNRLVLSTYK